MEYQIMLRKTTKLHPIVRVECRERLMLMQVIRYGCDGDL